MGEAVIVGMASDYVAAEYKRALDESPMASAKQKEVFSEIDKEQWASTPKRDREIRAHIKKMYRVARRNAGNQRLVNKAYSIIPREYRLPPLSRGWDVLGFGGYEFEFVVNLAVFAASLGLSWSAYLLYFPAGRRMLAQLFEDPATGAHNIMKMVLSMVLARTVDEEILKAFNVKDIPDEVFQYLARYGGEMGQRLGDQPAFVRTKVAMLLNLMADRAVQPTPALRPNWGIRSPTRQRRRRSDYSSPTTRFGFMEPGPLRSLSPRRSRSPARRTRYPGHSPPVIYPHKVHFLPPAHRSPERSWWPTFRLDSSALEDLRVG